jgi:hypothetical protein
VVGEASGVGSAVVASPDVGSADVVPLWLGELSVEVGELVDGPLDAPVGDVSVLPSVPPPGGDGVDVVPDDTGGASWRIATISDLKASSCVAISGTEYDVMFLPNSVSRPHTSPSASSCSAPGVSSTDSTSWLAIAAVMQR